MSSFLPSEISRLTYGYLKTHCSQNLADKFCKSCPSMKECRQMKNEDGRNFHATVQDLTLEMMLDQYSRLCSSIFKYFDEDKRQHKNILNLLEIILKKHQPEQSTHESDARVFKDVQNVSSNRDIPEIRIIEVENRENEPLALKGIEMFADQRRKISPSKKKPASSLQLTDRELVVTNRVISLAEAQRASPAGDSRVLQNIDSGLDHSSNVYEDQLAKVNTSNTRSKVPTSHPPQKLILHSSENIQLHEAGQSLNYSLANSYEKPNHRGPIPMSKELACENETSVVEENEQTEKSSSEIIHSQENPISSAESAKIVPSGHSVSPASSVQADWKAIFCNSFKFPTPLKSASQKMTASGVKTVSKSNETFETIKEIVPPQESIQVFFENMSKGFKHRSHPYLSPAKSNGLLHQAALSPVSKMYVTPAKAKIQSTAATSNHSVASNALSSSSISSSQRSIFSPISFDSPCSKETLAIEEPKKGDAEEKLTSKRVSTAEKNVSVKRKRCPPHKPQLSYDVNDEIVKKVNEISNIKDLHANTALDTISIKNSRKEVLGHKNALEVFRQGADSTKEKENKTSKKKKNPRLPISSSRKSIKRSRNEENHCENELKGCKEDTNEIVPRSIQTFDIEEMFREMVLRVFVKDTCEIAELDVSSKFLIYHRDSS